MKYGFPSPAFPAGRDSSGFPRADVTSSILPSIRFVLILPDPKFELDPLTTILRSHGIVSIVCPSPEKSMAFVARRKPDVAIVGAEFAKGEDLLQGLTRRGIPIVLVGDSDRMRQLSGANTVDVEMIAPVDPGELVGVAETLAFGDLPFPPSQTIEVGRIRIDLGSCFVCVEGNSLALPPKEFSILYNLALRPRHPLSSNELLRRAWPETASGTTQDVHWHVYKLRTLIGDRVRKSPLIRNRRGYGYFLEP